MDNNKYTDSELQLMSYQELRRLSILLQLPANIKKKYMIPMIQAHQKGDGCTKTAIANKILEERKVKRMGSKGKHSKSFMMGATTASKQISPEMSVSKKHEFETRFSYVAHYSSKDNINSRISSIMKQEAEVSRRNQNILQQPKKSTRKISTVERTEIMLPRNHSLTTPVRLMPQYERSYAGAAQYEPPTGIPNPKNHFQEANSYNYYFHEEYSNTMIPPPPQDLCRNEPYWHTREVYNSSLMPILTSLLSPNSVAINSSAYAAQYTAQNIMKESTSFQQEAYEKYIKSSSVIENQTFQSGVANSSSMMPSNYFPSEDNNSNNVTQGCRSYMATKSDFDFEINPGLDEMSGQQYSRRDESVARSSNGGQPFIVDIYVARMREPAENQYVSNLQDLSHCNEDCSEERRSDLSPYQSYEKSYKGLENESPVDSTAVSPKFNESSYLKEKFWEKSDDSCSPEQPHLSEVSESSTDLLIERDTNDLDTNGNGEGFTNLLDCLSRCRYIQGHNRYPGVLSKTDETTKLPSFLSTFRSRGLYNQAYSICNNSYTGTTKSHLCPVMSCMIQRKNFYACGEPQPSFTMDSSTYNSLY